MSIARVARVAVTAPHAVRRATAARRPFPVVRGKVAVGPTKSTSKPSASTSMRSMPTSILGDLEGLQEEAGAEFDDDGVPLNFGDSAYEANILRTKVGIVDRSGGWRVLRLAGPGAVPTRSRLRGRLARTSTRSWPRTRSRRAPRPGRRRVRRARLSRGLAGDGAGGGGGCTGEGGGDAVKDLAEQCTLLSLVGPDAAELLVRSGARRDGARGGHARTFGFEGCPVVAAFGGDLLASGWDVSRGGEPSGGRGHRGSAVELALKGQGAEPVGSQALDAVLAGEPTIAYLRRFYANTALLTLTAHGNHRRSLLSLASFAALESARTISWRRFASPPAPAIFPSAR